MPKPKFKSFVMPETILKQIDAMPNMEMKFKFYETVMHYGMYGTEPEDLTGLEAIIWISMKDLLDNSAKNTGGAPEGNQNAKKTSDDPDSEEPEATQNNQNNLVFDKTTQNNQNNLVFDKTTQTTLSNDNDNDNDNDNGNVNVNDNAQSVENTQLDTHAFSKLYSDTVFKVFRDAQMPCANGNDLSFYQRDFKNAMTYKNLTPELKQISSEEIIKACKNYVAIVNHHLTYPGYRHKYSFDRFIKWDKFSMFLPANFVADNFKDLNFKTG